LTVPRKKELTYQKFARQSKRRRTRDKPILKYNAKLKTSATMNRTTVIKKSLHPVNLL